MLLQAGRMSEAGLVQLITSQLHPNALKFQSVRARTRLYVCVYAVAQAILKIDVKTVWKSIHKYSQEFSREPHSAVCNNPSSIVLFISSADLFQILTFPLSFAAFLTIYYHDQTLH